MADKPHIPTSEEAPDILPRQELPTLSAALETAVRMIRAQSRAYRNPHGEEARRMNKRVRQSAAATLDDYARIIEAHSPSPGEPR
jgi:hypothetical protein